jgi:predicted acetyltransferase
LQQEQGMAMFKFHSPGELIDSDLELILVEEYPGDPTINYVPAYKFKMSLVGQGNEIGHIELRVGNTNHIVMYGGHIAYEVAPEHRGHRYAARACKLLFPLAQSHGLETIWITCNPDNIASRKTCELAGAQLVEIVDLPEDTDMYQEGERQKCRFRLDLQGTEA